MDRVGILSCDRCYCHRSHTENCHVSSKTRAQSYYGDLTLSQSFQPMAAQLSKKAALTLAEILATRHVAIVRQGPRPQKERWPQIQNLEIWNDYIYSIGAQYSHPWSIAGQYYSYKPNIRLCPWTTTHNASLLTCSFSCGELGVPFTDWVYF